MLFVYLPTYLLGVLAAVECCLFIVRASLNCGEFEFCRNRLKEIEHKFDVMPTDADVRTALQAIRLKEESKQENKAEKEPEIYQPWYVL